MLTFEIVVEEEDERPMYLTGNFNDWNPADDKYKMKVEGEGKFSFDFTDTALLNEQFEYKYTRGGWGNVELDKYGNLNRNRKLTEFEGTIRDTVVRWKVDGSWFKPELLPQIVLVDDAFEMPQLGKTRRIWALLPYNYDQCPDKKYPVIYLQDAQNLFNEKNPFGNWAVDKKMAVLAEQDQGDIIIIAVDHGEKERIEEYSPFKTTFGKGEGKKYIRFMADTLKPFIDKKFRTNPDREFTGIGGSSMGGLISIYAGLMYPEVYGRLMVFSPSLWMVPHISFQNIHFIEPMPTDIYIYAGEKESKDMIPNVIKFKQTIASQGHNASPVRFNVNVDPEGKHTESRWSEEFPKAIDWLFFD